MNLKQLLLLLGMVVAFASCSHIYEPALYHQDIVYQPKPTSFDTVKAANYISGGFNANSNSNYNDFLVSGQVNLSRGYVFNNFNLAFGAFGSFGQYESDQANKGAANYFTNKYFEVLGGRFSANAFVTSGRADIRFIGVEMSYSHEYGTYADFRRYLNTQAGNLVDPRTDLFTMGLTSEVIFHNVNDKSFQNGIRVFYGGTFGNNSLYRDPKLAISPFSFTTATGFNFFAKASYFIQVRNYIGSVEIGNGFFLRFGYKF
jgi:hypothetical protein